MKFYIFDVQKGKGFWKSDYAGYTHDYTQAGLYDALELPTYAGDCWIAIPQWNGTPNLRLLAKMTKGEGSK
tara:strand:- start:980 stop:1192 length:213 start_codon:yes stop_codon:yes gene_type:complete